jgi:uncharacterized protein YndB with AHSA1/START domain
MADSRFVYVIYIRTTPEKLWQALIDPEFTRQFWVGTWQARGAREDPLSPNPSPLGRGEEKPR